MIRTNDSETKPVRWPVLMGRMFGRWGVAALLGAILVTLALPSRAGEPSINPLNVFVDLLEDEIDAAFYAGEFEREAELREMLISILKPINTPWTTSVIARQKLGLRRVQTVRELPEEQQDHIVEARQHLQRATQVRKCADRRGELDDVDHAEHYEEKTCEMAATSLGQVSLRDARTWFNLALVYYDDEQFREAINLMSRARQICDRHRDDQLAGYASCQIGIAKCLVALGRDNEAAEIYQTILRDYEQLTPAELKNMPDSRKQVCDQYADVLARIDYSVPVQAPAPRAQPIPVVAPWPRTWPELTREAEYEVFHHMEHVAGYFFYHANFKAESMTWRCIVDFLTKYTKMRPRYIALRKARLESVEHVLALDKADRQKIAEARACLARVKAMAASNNSRRIAKYKKALEIYKSLVGEHDAVVAETYPKLGDALCDLDRFEQALSAFKIAVRLRNEPYRCGKAYQILTGLFEANLELEHYKDAEQNALAAARLAASRWEKDSRHYANAIVRLALVRKKSGQYEAAATTFGKAKQLIESLGPKHDDMRVTCELLQATMLAKLGRSGEAVKLFENALPTAEDRVDEGSLVSPRDLAEIYTAFVKALKEEGHEKRATKTMKKAQALENVVHSLRQLIVGGKEHYQLEHYDKAKQMYLEAARIIASRWGKDSKRYAQVVQSVATAQYGSKQYEVAQATFLKAVTLYKSLGPEYAAARVSCELLQARALAKLGRPGQAITIYHRVLPEAEKVLDYESQVSIGNLPIHYAEFAKALKKAGFKRRAAETREKIEELAEKYHSFRAFYELYRANLKLRRYDKAEQLTIAAARIAASRWGKDSERYANAIYNLAYARGASGQYEAAANTFLKAKRLFESLGPKYAGEGANNCELMEAFALSRLGRSDEAIAIFERALPEAEKFQDRGTDSSPGELSNFYNFYAAYAKALKKAGHNDRAADAMKTAKELYDKAQRKKQRESREDESNPFAPVQQ